MLWFSRWYGFCYGYRVGPYSYLWDDSNVQTADTATNLSEGTYFVTITNAINCEVMDSVQVVEPTLLATTQEPPQFNDFTYIGEYQKQFHLFTTSLQLNWTDARQLCLSNGGDLLLIKILMIKNYYSSILPGNSWIGLYQDLNDPNYSEPQLEDGNGLTARSYVYKLGNRRT